jgi:hypothetical protein
MEGSKKQYVDETRRASKQPFAQGPVPTTAGCGTGASCRAIDPQPPRPHEPLLPAPHGHFAGARLAPMSDEYS